jgi:hypothetical protein
MLKAGIPVWNGQFYLIWVIRDDFSPVSINLVSVSFNLGLKLLPVSLNLVSKMTWFRVEAIMISVRYS